MNSPSCVPWNVLRVAILYPSASMSSTVKYESAKATLNIDVGSLIPSQSVGSLDRALWSWEIGD